MSQNTFRCNICKNYLQKNAFTMSELVKGNKNNRTCKSCVGNKGFVQLQPNHKKIETKDYKMAIKYDRCFHVLEQVTFFMTNWQGEQSFDLACDLSTINFHEYWKALVVIFSCMIPHTDYFSQKALDGLVLVSYNEFEESGLDLFEWMSHTVIVKYAEDRTKKFISLIQLRGLKSVPTESKKLYRKHILSIFLDNELTKLTLNICVEYLKGTGDIQYELCELIKTLLNCHFEVDELNEQTTNENKLKLIALDKRETFRRDLGLSILSVFPSLKETKIGFQVHLAEFIKEVNDYLDWKTRAVLVSCLFYGSSPIFLESICESLLDLVSQGVSNERCVKDCFLFLLTMHISKSTNDLQLINFNDIEPTLERLPNMIALSEYKNSDENILAVDIPKQIILLVGSPGSGKTTLGSKLSNCYFSFGKLRRISPFLVESDKLKAKLISTFLKKFVSNDTEHIAIIESIHSLEDCFKIGEALAGYNLQSECLCFHLNVEKSLVHQRLSRRELSNDLMRGSEIYEKEISYIDWRIQNWERKKSEITYCLAQMTKLFDIPNEQEIYAKYLCEKIINRAKSTRDHRKVKFQKLVDVKFEVSDDGISITTSKKFMNHRAVCPRQRCLDFGNVDGSEAEEKINLMKFVFEFTRRDIILRKLEELLQTNLVKLSLPTNIITTAQQNFVCNPNRYFVTKKINGLGMWLFIDQELGSFMIDRYMFIYECTIDPSLFKNSSVLLDCEIIPNYETNSVQVFVFDILMLDQSCVWKLGFPERLSVLENWFADSNVIENSTNFIFIKKDHFPSEITTINGLIELDNEDLPVDGLIFTPVGHYRFGRSEFLLKYQTGVDLTLDLEVNRISFALESGTKTCYVNLPGDLDIYQLTKKIELSELLLPVNEFPDIIEGCILSCFIKKYFHGGRYYIIPSKVRHDKIFSNNPAGVVKIVNRLHEMECLINDKNLFSNFEEESEKVVVRSLPLKSTNPSKNKKRVDNEVDLYSEDEEPEYLDSFVLHPWTREWPSNRYRPSIKRKINKDDYSGDDSDVDPYEAFEKATGLKEDKKSNKIDLEYEQLEATQDIEGENIEEFEYDKNILSKLFKEENKTTNLKKTINPLLNKLSSNNYETIKNQFVMLHETIEKDLESLTEVGNLIFEQSLNDRRFISVIADLCVALSVELTKQFHKDGNDINLKWVLNKNIMESIEKNLSSINSNNKDSRIPHQLKNTVALIGEFYIRSFLTFDIHELIDSKLLTNSTPPSDFQIELAILLLTTVNFFLGDPSQIEKSEIYYLFLQRLTKDEPLTIDTRTVYLIQNILDYVDRTLKKSNIEVEVEVRENEGDSLRPQRHPAFCYDFDLLYSKINSLVKEGRVNKFIEGNVEIYDYLSSKDCSNEFISLCRGLVIEPKFKKIVNAPFTNFKTAKTIHDLDQPVLAFEKIDGSLIIAFLYEGTLFTMTRKRTSSEQATWAKKYIESKGIILLPGKTYLFEAVYHDNFHLIDHQSEDLFLHCIYDENGYELPFEEKQKIARSIGVREPYMMKGKLRDFVRMSRCLETLEIEGWICLLGNGKRIKVKNKLYSKASRIQRQINPLSIWYHMKLNNFGCFLNSLSILPLRLLNEAKEMFQAFDNQFESLKSSLLFTVQSKNEKVFSFSELNLDLLSISSKKFNELLNELKLYGINELKKQKSTGPRRFLRVKMVEAIMPDDKTSIRGFTPSKNFLQTRCKSWEHVNEMQYDGSVLFSMPLINDIIYQIIAFSKEHTTCFMVCKHWQFVIAESLGPRMKVVFELEANDKLISRLKEERNPRERDYPRNPVKRWDYYQDDHYTRDRAYS